MDPSPSDRRRRGAGKALGIFLKAPIAGRVKTRLGARLGMGSAARLHSAFALDVLEQIAPLRATTVWIFFTPAEHEEACKKLAMRASSRAAGFLFKPQCGADLGERMLGAFRQMFRQASRVLLVGTDLPTFDSERAEEAFAALEGDDVVFGPAADGGYYLLGLRRVYAELFRGIRWSTDSVLEVSRRRLRSRGVSDALLIPERDVDTFADLAALWDDLEKRGQRGLPVPQRTVALCRELLRRPEIRR